ncbi:Uncharacterized protein conserved in bacteria, NMA0228-like [[Actinomadura] parvosata subsp. kistnae]|uniref:Endonuclease n=1 Tax=[Actinomadura] parvosata subsp. kistnae TaxID=1909395 RepID=A0A1U9ZZM2_9ACTN|nr:DUF692 family multinuclear iron-containing protein [Nonomuraea sp. ATCC 55076]AQZ63406.1 hypothetical protein BKM31_19790 [Nonomuraea sp. ATCC 55076]SPL99127.1 Uncharacterized protein conserved in bacteria, NMA0228-like [Actinomadura parvosata subsp. kistnae]
MSDLQDLRELPELGVGLVYWPEHDGLLDLVDVVEVEPQVFWFPARAPGGPYELDARAFQRLARIPKPKLVHGVGCPVGGTVADERHLRPFADSVALLQAAWASEHLSFNQAGPHDLGFLLPPVQSEEGIALAVANIRRMRELLPVPFAFETGVSYLRPVPGELPDGTFFAAVARAAGCGILLDLHNLWANERNGRQRVLDVVSELPLERVIEVHLAGGQEYAGYWVDAHSGPVAPEVMECARQVIPRLPNLKAVVYEVMPDSAPPAEETRDQLRELRELWKSRGSAATPTPPAPAVWEHALATALQSRGAVADPGIAVLRELIASVRAGKVADALPLTTRLLLLTLGGAAVDELFAGFWTATPSQPMAADEARRFAAHVGDLPLEVPHLREVMAFELAAQQAVLTGRAQAVSFGVDPGPVLTSLLEGRLPSAQPPGSYEITVSPPP